MAASHRRTVPSSSWVTPRAPSGDQAAHITPRRRVPASFQGHGAPEAASQASRSPDEEREATDPWPWARRTFPSGDQAGPSTDPAVDSRTRSSPIAGTSHRRTCGSSPQTARTRPSGDHARVPEAPTPLSPSTGGGRSRATSAPVAGSKTETPPSEREAARRAPSGAHATPRKVQAVGLRRGRRRAKEVPSQRRTAPSSPAVARVRPFGDQAAPWTWPVWPPWGERTLPVSASWIQRAPWNPPEAIRSPPWDQANPGAPPGTSISPWRAPVTPSKTRSRSRFPPVRIRFPSGDQRPFATERYPFPASRSATSRPSEGSQRRASPSLQESSRVPSGDHATPSTLRSWPFRVNSSFPSAAA